jgi:anti-sigma factor RsiW
MNKCAGSDIQERLPDLLHRALADDERLRVEEHLATCESCQEDLEVLRTVKNAVVFAPSIDVDRVVRQIPPYRTIVPAPERPDIPATERPARTRVASWLVAASLVLVVAAGGSILFQSNGRPKANSSEFGPAPIQIANAPEVGKASPAESVAVPKTGVQTGDVPHTHALALAADADGLSDGSLVQLMNDMDGFDALPASEPDPVISVDSGDSL